MNGMNNSSDDVAECPLCMEPLEVDDLNFYPCTCGYQICRFCWHRIRTDENELCPACRKAYPENPADFTPLTQEEMVALKSQKRQRDQQRKQKITENRKHLANVRVVQKNLVFVVGLPPRLADADILKRHEYFGKYGKIHKVVINPSTAYAGVQGPSASAYVTYVHNCDALRAIQSVNNISIDGRLIKTSLGTTKYCSHFMKNQQCPKGDCMYLHELGDLEASFTKEEMHQGKHQEYEKRLHDLLIASSETNGAPGGGSSVGGNPGSGATNNANGTGVGPVKDAWPSLSVSPTNNKELTNGSGSGGGKREKVRGKKSKGDKGKKNSNNHNNNNSSNQNSSKDNQLEQSNSTQNMNGENDNSTMVGDMEAILVTTKSSSTGIDKKSADKQQLQQQQNSSTAEMRQLTNDAKSNHLSVDDEMKLIEDIEKDNSGEEVDGNEKDVYDSSLSSSSSNCSDHRVSPFLSESSSSGNSSPGGFTDHHTTIQTTDTHLENLIKNKSSSSSRSSSGSNQDTNSKLSSSSSTPASPAGELNGTRETSGVLSPTPTSLQTQKLTNPESSSSNIIDTTACLSKLNLLDDNNSFFSSASSFQPIFKGKLDTDMRNSQSNHLSSVPSQLPDLLNGIDGYQNSTLNGTATANGINFLKNPESYLFSSSKPTEDWEDAFKCVMTRNNKQMEEQLVPQLPHQQQQLHQQQQHQSQQQQQQQEEFLRMQEMQKRNLLNNIGISQMNGPHDFPNIGNNYNGATDLSRLSQTALIQQQQQQLLQQQQERQHTDQLLFGTTSMSRFFDFHKNQQQLHQLVMNGGGNNAVNDLRLPSVVENNRINSQFLDQTNGLLGQQPLQKQRLPGKYDPLGAHNLLGVGGNSGNQHPQQQPPPPPPQSQLHHQHQQQQQQQTPLRLVKQFSAHNSSVDDELGFDPFAETQKALAELIENEVVQQQNVAAHQKHMLDNVQRPRMPPPGFNHMNAFGFGVPRAQGSKILPFMNMAGMQQPPTIPPQQQPPNNWNPHLPNFQQQQHSHDPQMHMNQQNQNGGNHNKGYGNTISDWTAMDPAILSFRQFSSFPHQQQPQHHPQQPPTQQQQHTGPDMFMQHLNQQNGQGFGPQPPQHHGVNLPNNLLNPQQNSQAQVNYPQIANWLSNEQNLFMNSLANGFVANNSNNIMNSPLNGYTDKFSIAMPPGILSNNINTQKQTTECIN